MISIPEGRRNTEVSLSHQRGEHIQVLALNLNMFSYNFYLLLQTYWFRVVYKWS